MSNGEFSVCQFFADDSYEYVKRFVDAEEAVKAARHYTDNVAVKMGSRSASSSRTAAITSCSSGRLAKV
jgi:hypothetical protein